MMRVRVVWGLSEVMATLVPTMRFTSVDFPTLGRPTKVTKPERISASLAAGGAGSKAWTRWTRTRPMRRPTTRWAVSSQPSTSTDSPSTGTWPSWARSRPPIVSQSPSGSWARRRSFTSSTAMRAFTR